MRAHSEKCHPKHSNEVVSDPEQPQCHPQPDAQGDYNSQPPTMASLKHPAPGPSPQPKRIQLDLHSHLIKTSSGKKEELDDKVAEFVYACNLPFSIVEHPTFITLVTALRPGYQLPTRKALGLTQLDKTHAKLQADMKSKLHGKIVTIQQDGWSNIHNDPIVASCVSVEGSSYFIDAKDTGSTAKTAQNCKEMIKDSKTFAETQYGCKVVSVVTDNAKNMERMRKDLEEEEPELITYGCLAHWLNLLGQDLTPPQIMKHVVEVQKFFRNHHVPSAYLKNFLGSVKPQLPGDTRWKSQLSCLDSFIKNRPYLMQIIQDHPEDVDTSVAQKVMNMGLFNQVRELSEQLRPIASAIDRAQCDNTNLADACDIFLRLLSEPVLAPYRETVQKRFKQAILPCHFVAHMMHPKYLGDGLTMDQVETAKMWLVGRDPTFLPAAIAFQAEADPFPESFFRPAARQMKPVTWWKGIRSSAALPAGFIDLMVTLQSACCSSASLERVFSSFGLVHTKLRNRLGNDKSQKLVFCYRMLRGCNELEY